MWDTPGLKTITVSAQNCNLPGASASFEVLVGPLPLTEAPLDAHRRAAQLLAEQKAGTQSPEWAQARLSDRVTPLYRPDLAEPAYWEFAVVAPAAEGGAVQGAATLPDEPAGFIIVSAAEHDYPVTNWTTSGLPPSARLKAAHPEVVKVFKLDVLSYVGEDASGAMVGQDGDLPPKIEGLPADWRTRTDHLVAEDWAPTANMANDPDAGDTPFVAGRVTTGTPSGLVQLRGWDSWQQLKGDYAETFEPFVETLRENAAEAWQAEENVRTSGHTLFLGDSLVLPLLWGEYDDIDTSGPGLPLVNIEKIDNGIETTGLRVTAVGAVPGEGQQVVVDIYYTNGIHETVNILVADRWERDWEHKVFLPAGSGHPEQVNAASEPATAAPAAPVQGASTYTDADGYTYWYVGASKDAADDAQCWYDQFDADDPVNDTDCMSGCGPTAWAMLIGWGDRIAAGGSNSAWAGRWGLYRWQAGRIWDRVAPQHFDDGFEGPYAKDMIMEINHDVGTFCNAFNDNGATYPGTMHLVLNYLDGRSGMQVNTWYLQYGIDPFGYNEQTLISNARNVIKNENDWARPAVIGTGFFSHYPLAYGYRQKQQPMCWNNCDWEGCTQSCTFTLLKGFYVNQGWGGDTGEWVAADLFFTGRIKPHRAYVDDVVAYRDSTRYFYYDLGHDGILNKTQSPWGWPVNVRPLVGDFDRDRVLDDLGIYIYAHGTTSVRYDWKFDFNSNRSKDAELDAWVWNSDGWPIALDLDSDGWVDDLGLYIPSLRSWRWNKDYTGGSDGSALDWGFSDSDRPISGDFDSDGYHDDIALFTPVEHRRHLAVQL